MALLWIDFNAEFRAFSDELGAINPLIGLIWSKLSSQAVCLDLSIQIADYSKPDNVFALLPLLLFHLS